jgi:glucokinase
MKKGNSKLAVGIDVGGSFFKAGLVTDKGEIVERDRRPVRKQTREEFYSALRELVDEIITRAGGAELVGIGIGVPGFIHRKRGTIEQSPNLQVVNGAPIFDDLKRLLPLPSVIDNDANAAAWGEYWAGGGGDAELLILLTLGSGIGGGIVWRGDVWRGAIGYGGEIGHTVITPGGPLCNCGRRGCIEAEFSDTAFARKSREAIAAGRKTVLAEKGNARIFGKDVTDAAEAGDEVALEIVTASSRLLGQVVGNLINALNPDQIVLGGGLIAAADLLMPLIMEGVRERSLIGALEACDVRPSVLGNDAGLLGASGLAWREFGA